jgi:hypothetical protein
VFAPVEPAPAAAPTYGTLVAAAITPQDGTRWQAGMAWRPERCPQGRTFDPCGSTFSDLVGGGGDGIVYYRPPAFRIEDRCSTRTGVLARDVGRVRRQAEGATSFMVARELESGAQSLAEPYDSPNGVDQHNAYLASPDATVIPGVWSLPEAIGELEAATRAAQLGMDAFLHIPLMPLPLVSVFDLVREGALLRTMTGARIVADPGYTGTGPLVPGTSEVQTVTITGAPTGGNFTLTYQGDTTSAIGYNSPALDVQGALNELDSLAGDDVTVSGAAGGPYTVTFPAALGDVQQMLGDGSGLTGGTAPDVVVATTTPGVAPAASDGLWLYGTGPVTVRLDPIRTESLVDHTANEVVNVAERVFAATFDPCTLFAIEIEDPTPVVP